MKLRHIKRLRDQSARLDLMIHEPYYAWWRSITPNQSIRIKRDPWRVFVVPVIAA